MTTIHFVRHGEVENPDNIYYGRLSGFPLSEDGRKCIDYTGQQLRRYPIEAVYYSPILRTKQTAKILGPILGCPIIEDERLVEIASFFEGKPKGEATRVTRYPPASGGYAETMVEIYERMSQFVRERAGERPGQQFVAVTHGGPIRILELGLIGKPFTDAIYAEEEVPICGADTIVTINGSDITVKRTDL